MSDTPNDPDMEIRKVRSSPWPVLGVVSLGGALGASARYGLQQAFPHRPDQFEWTTFVINAMGCLLIGVLMSYNGMLRPGSRLLYPFLGTGVLGGFTTFSSYVVDIQRTLAADGVETAWAYLAATVVTALFAVWMGTVLTTWALQRRRTTKADR